MPIMDIMTSQKRDQYSEIPMTVVFFQLISQLQQVEGFADMGVGVGTIYSLNNDVKLNS